MKPLVSIIIPTYNRTEYLKYTLESVINQTYPATEIIVVDDGSPNTKTQTLCQHYKNVAYYKIENSGGPATPRNFGFKQSKGQYIAFLDDDDLWLPDKLSKQVKILEENPDFGIAHSYCDVIDKEGKPTGVSIGRPGSLDVKHGDVSHRMIGNWTLKMPTPLVRRTVIEEVGLFNTEIPAALEDTEYWTRCSFYTKFYYMDESLALYRLHGENISNAKHKYVDLPLYLKDIIVAEKEKGNLSKQSYNKLLLNVCFSQTKHLKINGIKTFVNLFKLNPFWIINFRIWKLIVRRVLRIIFD